MERIKMRLVVEAEFVTESPDDLHKIRANMGRVVGSARDNFQFLEDTDAEMPFIRWYVEEITK